MSQRSKTAGNVSSCIDSTCFVCRSAGGAAASGEWYDKVLARSNGLALAIAGVGAVVPGYVQVCPIEHCGSLAEMDQSTIPAFLDLLDAVTGRLVSQFGDVIMFEHGGSSGTSTSSCVDHAHLHVMASDIKQGLSIPGETVLFGSLEQFLLSSDSPARDRYVLVVESNGSCRIGGDPGVSQFFRRQVAELLGHPDEWDYAAFPNFENVQRTIDAFGVA